MAAKPRRIILAVDLKADEPKWIEKSWKAIQPLLAQGDTVEPVAVLNQDDVVLGGFIKSTVGKIRLAAERHLSDELARLKIKGMAAPKILFAEGTSTQESVLTLVDYAAQQKASLIAVGTHSRKGMKRLLLGSFAETLSLESPIPIYVINAKFKSARSLKTILFPTDFSAESKDGLDSLCESFSDQKPRIVLFHNYVPIVALYGDPFFGTPLPQGAVRTMVKEEIRKATAKGQAWCEELTKKGFKSECIVDSKSVFIGDGIARATRKSKADLIAMVSTTGALAAAMLGSTTRQTLRSAAIPVWVFHPRARTKMRRTPVTHWEPASKEFHERLANRVVPSNKP